MKILGDFFIQVGRIKDCLVLLHSQTAQEFLHKSPNKVTDNHLSSSYLIFSCFKFSEDLLF